MGRKTGVSTSPLGVLSLPILAFDRLEEKIILNIF